MITMQGGVEYVHRHIPKSRYEPGLTKPVTRRCPPRYGYFLEIRGQRHRSVIITMAIVRVVEMSVDQIVNMPAVGYSLVPAIRAMCMRLRVA
ncbi:hypothetical protein [Nitrosospira sp. NpAV]|uniref:hypothetical protein n=1 Tax=Nitrosospira sp. NpAV TaxID=58133 RepID=UPI0012EC4F0E|nr:hypothetical protein [Nitrosospira sp. NpAV]